MVNSCLEARRMDLKVYFLTDLALAEDNESLQSDIEKLAKGSVLVVESTEIIHTLNPELSEDRLATPKADTEEKSVEKDSLADQSKTEDEQKPAAKEPAVKKETADTSNWVDEASGPADAGNLDQWLDSVDLGHCKEAFQEASFSLGRSSETAKAHRG
eukprot:TRINITY_DN4548_c0_g1_i1.p1 TRINITY_DN4548_c0_g1~~TRINITY_DN4548_c0_g1_i1.p1  ORF type:complete len:158 (+),score=42.18 TRINITY_DN4548_c0_g1_i1:296-769(+)